MQVLELGRQDHVRGSGMDVTPLKMFGTYSPNVIVQALNSSKE